MYHTNHQKKTKEEERIKGEKLEKAFYDAYNKAFKKHCGSLPVNLINFFDFEAHRLGIPHDCKSEDAQTAWNACLSDADGDREKAQDNFAI